MRHQADPVCVRERLHAATHMCGDGGSVSQGRRSVGEVETTTETIEATTPAQQRVLDELLAVGAPRPVPDATLAGRLREHLEAELAPVAERIPAGEQLVLNKSRLAALVCDGRYLDLLEGDFAWTVEMVRGKLAHLAIDLDWFTGRDGDAHELVSRAWADLAARSPSLATFLAELHPVDAAALHHEAVSLVTEFRDLWPALPRSWATRLEASVAASFAGRRIQVRGRPDLILGTARRDRTEVIVIDLKTGWRRPQRDRHDLRLYALLLTLKYGIAPFRVGTYYVTEGAWDVEAVTESTLEAAVRQVVDGAAHAARLSYGDRQQLDLVPGGHCRWCSLAPECPAIARIAS